MDEETRTQLAIIAARARGMFETLALIKGERLPHDDHTNHDYNTLLTRTREALGAESPVAALLPGGIQPMTMSGGIPKSRLMAAAQGLATTIDTFLAREPGRLEQLQREKETLEAKAAEAEGRAVTILDDELKDSCLELLARPGKADTAVRDACVLLEDRLRATAGLSQDVHGVDLVDRALNPRDGVLVFSNVSAEQQGIHNVYRGVIGFFKNPTSHRLMREYDLTRARQVVGLVDLLLSLLREARRRNSP